MAWLFAAIYDRFMRRTEEHLAAWRADLLRDVRGRVLELGAGTGVNVPFYPAGLERLVLAEPDRHMRARLAARVARERPDAEVVDASAEALPFEDASFDVVVSTLVLCSVEDLDRALGEVRRVLRPEGSLVFLEHVAADDRPDRLRWQRRIEPVWRRVAGNCHLTRRTAEAIAAAGFDLRTCERESVRKALPFVRPSVRGVAVRSLRTQEAAPVTDTTPRRR